VDRNLIFCYLTVQKEVNQNFWTQTVFNEKIAYYL